MCHYLCLYQVLGHDSEQEDRYVLQSSAFAQMHRSHLTTKLFMSVFNLCLSLIFAVWLHACMYVLCMHMWNLRVTLVRFLQFVRTFFLV